MRGKQRRRRIKIAVIAIAAAVAVLVVLRLTGVFHSSQFGNPPDRKLYPVRGIDISAHNGDIDFPRLAAEGIDFVFIKATEGATFKDRRFVDNYRMAMEQGMKVGAYHFFRFDVPGRMQALNMLNSIRGRRLHLPLVIDVEESGNPTNHLDRKVLERLEDMVRELQDEGYPVMVYTNKKGLQRYLADAIPDGVPLWICSFTNPPLEDDRRWLFWQYSHYGRMPGVGGPVDLNTFYGSRPEWERWLESVTIGQPGRQ